ncbi:MAG: hypothetical protein L7F77_11245 [Candidatus Magnetominusculus sp. LBB02]|nr:hypothetical protein [Candidatus Magnetominusculus sp. LBB02]
MTRRTVQRLVVLLVTALLVASVSFAYEGGEVKGGVDVKGVIKYSGTPPQEQPLHIEKDEAVCGKEQKPDAYIVSSDKGIKNAVVWLEGVSKGKALPKQDTVITIKSCKVEPLVGLGFVDNDYVIKNEDTILHTIQLKLGLSYQKEVSGRPLKDGSTILNLALPTQNCEIKKPIKGYHRLTKDTGFISVKSNAHDWMRGYVFVFDQPYAAVTDAAGKFELTNVPPGEYVLRVWHEGMGISEQKIKADPDSKPIEIEITAAGKTAGEDAAPEAGKPQASFNEVKYDFGRAVADQTVEHTFELTNTGTGKLIIKDLIPA